MKFTVVRHLTLDRTALDVEIRITAYKIYHFFILYANILDYDNQSPGNRTKCILNLNFKNVINYFITI